MADLDLERQAVVTQLLKDVNTYIHTLAHNDWRNLVKLEEAIDLQGLKKLHLRVHLGDIKGIPKNNGKDEATIQAWRPIMCLNTIRKAITKIISNRTTDSFRIQTSVCSPHYNLAIKNEQVYHRHCTQQS